MARADFIQFERRSLWAWMDAGLALVWFSLAYFQLKLEQPLLATCSSLLAIIFAVEAAWTTRTPYARIDDQGIRVRDRLLGWWRYVAWSEVVGTEIHHSKIKLLRNGSVFTVRLGWVQVNQHDDLIAAIQYYTKSQSPGQPDHGFNRTPERSRAAKPGKPSGRAGQPKRWASNGIHDAQIRLN